METKTYQISVSGWKASVLTAIIVFGLFSGIADIAGRIMG